MTPSKRLIDGVTYNTETATLLARSTYEGDWNNFAWKLYQTRGGAFFIVEEGKRHGQDGAPVTKFRFQKCSESAARGFVYNSKAEVLFNPFENRITDDEAARTVYVRVPVSLKRQIEAAAEAESLSVNSWALRAFEKCLHAKPRTTQPYAYSVDDLHSRSLVKLAELARAFDKPTVAVSNKSNSPDLTAIIEAERKKLG